MVAPATPLPLPLPLLTPAASPRSNIVPVLAPGLRLDTDTCPSPHNPDEQATEQSESPQRTTSACSSTSAGHQHTMRTHRADPSRHHSPSIQSPAPLLTPELESEGRATAPKVGEHENATAMVNVSSPLAIQLPATLGTGPTDSGPRDQASKDPHHSQSRPSPPRLSPTAPLLLRRRSRHPSDDGQLALQGFPSLARMDEYAISNTGFRFGTCGCDVTDAATAPVAEAAQATPSSQAQAHSAHTKAQTSAENSTANESTRHPPLNAARSRPAFTRTPASSPLPITASTGFPFGAVNRTSTPTAELGPFEYPSPDPESSLSSSAGSTHSPFHNSTSVSQPVSHAPPRSPVRAFNSSAAITTSPVAITSSFALRSPSLATVDRDSGARVGSSPRLGSSPLLGSSPRLGSSPVSRLADWPPPSRPSTTTTQPVLHRRGSIALGQIPRLSRTLPSRPRHAASSSLTFPSPGSNNLGLIEGRRSSSTGAAAPQPPSGAKMPQRPLASPHPRQYLPPRVPAFGGNIAFAHAALPTPIPPSLLARRCSVPANLRRGLTFHSAPSKSPAIGPVTPGSIGSSGSVGSAGSPVATAVTPKASPTPLFLASPTSRALSRRPRSGTLRRWTSKDFEPEQKRPTTNSSPDPETTEPSGGTSEVSESVPATPWDDGRGDEVEFLTDDDKPGSPPSAYLFPVHPFCHSEGHGEHGEHSGHTSGKGHEAHFSEHVAGIRRHVLSTVPSRAGSDGGGD